MTRNELLRRIDAAKAKKGWSDRRASNEAGLGPDFIRDLRRHPLSKIAVHKLVALARALDLPTAYLIEENADLLTRDRPESLDPDRLRRATLAAERAVRDVSEDRREIVKADLIYEIYEVLSERARAGEEPDDEQALGLIDALIRRMVLSRVNPR